MLTICMPTTRTDVEVPVQREPLQAGGGREERRERHVGHPACKLTASVIQDTTSSADCITQWGPKCRWFKHLCNPNSSTRA